MATAMKKCRVCGRIYTTCRTVQKAAGVFRWQDVACSPECGSIYLAKIEESRRVKPLSPEPDKSEKADEVLYTTELFDDEEDDEELFNELDEYFDDVEETAN